MAVRTHALDFEEFYRGSKDECLLTVLVSVGDKEMAQDLVAEAFARAWAYCQYGSPRRVWRPLCLRTAH